jgi:hypothetical protein
MATQDIIKGKITIEFVGELTPRIKFEGQIDMLQMVGLPFQISGKYSEYLNEAGDILRRKVEKMGIEAKKNEEIKVKPDEVKTETATKEEVKL